MDPVIMIAIAVGVGLVVLGLVVELLSDRKPRTNPNAPVFLSAEEGGLRPQSQSQPQSSSMMPVAVIIIAAVILIAGVAIFTNGGLDFLSDPYRDEMADICNALDGSVESLEMPVHSGPWKVAVINHKGKWHDWYDKLPANRKATDVESTDVLVCVSGNRERIEEDCKYTADGRGVTGQEVYFTIRRIVLYRDAFLVNPKTGKTFRILKVLGGTPPLCPISDRRPKGINKEPGPAPRYETFYNELLTVIR